MALHTKKEFAQKCGMKTNGLSVYIDRKKVILSGDYIDDAVERNAEFLKKRMEIAADRGQDVVKSVKKLVISPPIDNPKAPNVVETNADSRFTELEKKKKSLDIEKMEEEIEILKVKKDKMQGVVIPTDLIKSLIVNHSESLKIAYIDASESLLLKIAAKKQLSRLEIVELKAENIKIINRAVDNAINESKKNIKNIVREFSDKRGKGERT